MTEKKTCYNCGNKNCNVYYSMVKKDYKRHFEIYEYKNFDCVNHNKWEELRVEEIRTDNTETLKNALERIAELEKENAERHAEILEAFASASSGDDFEMAEAAREIMEILNIPCYRHGKVVSKLTEAKKIIGNLYAICKNNHYPNSSVFMEQAEQFLKKVEK